MPKIQTVQPVTEGLSVKSFFALLQKIARILALT